MDQQKIDPASLSDREYNAQLAENARAVLGEGGREPMLTDALVGDLGGDEPADSGLELLLVRVTVLEQFIEVIRGKKFSPSQLDWLQQEAQRWIEMEREKAQRIRRRNRDESAEA